MQAQELQLQMQEKGEVLDVETEMRVATSKATNEPLVPADEMNSVLLNKVTRGRRGRRMERGGHSNVQF